MPTTDTDARDRETAEQLAAYADYASPGGLIAAIHAALATARAEERAGCVAVVEGLHRDAGDGFVGQTFTTTIALCAAALRARGEG